MPHEPAEHGFDHLVVLMLENRSFDNLCGFLYEKDEPKHFIGAGEPTFRGIAGRDDVAAGGHGLAPQRVHRSHVRRG